MLDFCDEPTRPCYSFSEVADYTCSREPNHPGQHHALIQTEQGERWYVWDGSSAVLHTVANSLNMGPCYECGVATTTPARCHSCKFWLQRVVQYTEKEAMLFRPHEDKGPFKGTPYLYHWSPGHHDGFGGRKFLIKAPHGIYGPDDCLWGNGQIPHHMLDLFPTNCTIEHVNPVRFRVEG